jgi:tRNA dimethylallyltransferase
LNAPLQGAGDSGAATPLGLCLAGPTASGKSALALALAEALADTLPVEIVSVDSALVYRGMDIGTAKPTAAERAAVPHHLIDLLDPAQSYSAARFAEDAARIAADVRGRGRLPLLVGGTMLYFKALRSGLDVLPPAEAAVRGWPALHTELARVDPRTAARLAPGDSQRVQRALEVFRVSGRPLSAWHGQADLRHSEGEAQAAAAAAAAARWPMLSLEPDSRAWLHQRIAERFDAMLAAGLIDEVRALRARPDLHSGLPSMRCVGYRQAWAALDAGTLDGLRQAGIAATRQLAKRQLTWLRSTPARTPFAPDRAGEFERAIGQARRVAGALVRALE